MNQNIITIRRNSTHYPARFDSLPDKPDLLYVIGELPDDHAPSVAIIGARMCSRYGHNTAFTFGKKLAEKGVSVVSGMALGIDGAAQEGALAGGGKTYAVLGCGVDVCYPRSNTNLYNQIPGHGGILSELPPGTKPLRYNFPLRNRLIAALADVVIVVEARKKSGSLITVDYALEQGKSVYAVPGRVGDALSDGCNFLIAQGAGIAWSVDAILEELAMQSSLSNAAKASRKACAAKARTAFAESGYPDKGADSKEYISAEDLQNDDLQYECIMPEGIEKESVKGKILCALKNDERTQNELAGMLGVSVADLNAAIGEMLLYGYIDEVGRGRYVRVR